ncbi:ABC transporter ATP-binding protein [Haladaptatus cibarius]|uniref:ABC transporter ATP-binding protein n=1 Tax=Haladaptatus cibarius TaxID=453847 RepID=UPI000A039D87|nr:oligopeptide/dipeptide ABC transporter ATP-binding protein [Haladaptatus cibarius]
MSDQPLLEVSGLKQHYPITQGLLNRQVGTVKAVDGIDIQVRAGETVGIVGESGCGKSTAVRSILQLEEPTDGTVLFKGKPVSSFEQEKLKKFRRSVQLIFQDPDSSFDPRMTIGESIAEPLVIHGMRNTDKRRSIAMNLLERVGLSANDVDRYPHEFSGGQKQRIALARALATNPSLIVADEPVSALDVSIQANVLSLLEDLQAEFGIGVLMISHNMGVIREVCDRVNVMYLGEIVESGPVERIFESPAHPYTIALLDSVPSPDPDTNTGSVQLSGEVPDPSDPPTGCRFHTRCPAAIQPDDYDFEQSAWRAVLDLRIHLREHGIDREAVLEFVGESGKSLDGMDITKIKNAIRDEFGIPKRVGDSAAEQILDQALKSIITGDQESAQKQLRNEFSTVCEQKHPSLSAVGMDRNVACLLHDGQQATKLAQKSGSIARRVVRNAGRVQGEDSRSQ